MTGDTKITAKTAHYSGDNMKLLIDHREHSKRKDRKQSDRIHKFKEYIYNGNSDIITDVEVTQLKVGDYATPDCMVGFEYKEGDFLQSTYSDLLNKQLHELYNAYEYPYLLIGFNGILDLLQFYEGTNPNIIIGKLTSIASRSNVTTLFCGDFLVPFVVKIIEKKYDGKTPTKFYSPIRTATKRNATTKELKLDNISRLPKVGAHRAETLLEAFDWSIHKLTCASVKDLMKVDGIGKTLATNIHEVLK